jgi:predicted permease
MTAVIQEIRHAARRLRKSPGFTLTAVLMLALGIGATTSVFSVLDAVLLRPLPFRDPARLVLIKENINKLADHVDLPAPDVLTFAQQSKAFEQLGGFERDDVELSGSGDPVRLASARLTAGVLPALGASPMLGRAFTADEDEHSQPVALLGYSLWKGRFHGDPNVLGRRLDINRNPYVVIGVMPADFEFPLVPGRLRQTELWIPMSFTPRERADAGDNFQYGAVARIRPGFTRAQAEQDANRVTAGIQAEYPAKMGITVSASLVRLQENAVAEARPLLRVLFGAVAVVLMIACANLAGLLLVRGVRRRREIAVRQALGASGRALLRYSMMESLLISLAGGALGVFLAWAGLRWWISLLPETLPRIEEIRLSWEVCLFALVVTIGTGLVCGLAPGLSALRSSPGESLKEGARSVAGHARLRSVLVVGEIATALMLVTGAGLLLRSFERMRAVSPGFDPERVIAASYDLPASRYATEAQAEAFHRELLVRLASVPGVKEAGLASNLPMAEPNSSRLFVAEGYNKPRGGLFDLESQAYVVGDFLQTMQIPLLRGRCLTAADTADAPLVAVVNRTLAERYWPGQDPIGKRIKWGQDPASELPWISVVGVVANTKQGALDSRPWAQVYEPLVQFGHSFGPAAGQVGMHGGSMRVAVRTMGDPVAMQNAVRRAVWSLDPELAVSNMQTMEQAIRQSEAPRRFNTAVLSAFALGAVLLAGLGIYGVIAFSVAQRTQEIAVRMALGAQPAGVLRLVLAAGARLAALGCVLGLAGAASVTRLMQSLLFEVSPFDPAVFASGAAVVLLLALAASFLPARRAAGIEPMEALRSE